MNDLPIAKVLTLRLKAKWWDQIASGAKPAELRRVTDYWQKRLIGRSYDAIHIWKGYPPKTDTSKLLVRPWRGVTTETIVHEEFGPNPVEVFRIPVDGVTNATEKT